MDQDTGWRVIDEQRARVADVLTGLAPEDWATASWCSGWTVREVASHLSLAARTPGPVTMVRTLIEARGDFDRFIDLSTRRRAAGKSETEIIDDLRSIVGSRKLAPTTKWRDPLLDILVHTQDLARPLGLVLPAPTEAAAEAADWAWSRGAPFWPTRRLAGVRLNATDVDWSRGSGAEVRGPVEALLLLSTGRRGVLTELTGDGVERLRSAPPTTG